MYFFDTFLCTAFFPLNFLNQHIKSEQLIEWEPFQWLVKMFYCKNNKNSTLKYLGIYFWKWKKKFDNIEMNRNLRVHYLNWMSAYRVYLFLWRTRVLARHHTLLVHVFWESTVSRQHPAQRRHLPNQSRSLLLQHRTSATLPGLHHHWRYTLHWLNSTTLSNSSIIQYGFFHIVLKWSGRIRYEAVVMFTSRTWFHVWTHIS